MENENKTAGTKPGWLKFLPGIAWFFIVMYIICLPGDDVPDEGWLNLSDYDKLIHAGMFGGLVFWFCFPFKKAAINTAEKTNLFTKILLATIIWALATEFIQKYFIPGRAYDILDWLADSAGAIVADLFSRRYFTK
jgi:hypothetical protein